MSNAAHTNQMTSAERFRFICGLTAEDAKAMAASGNPAIRKASVSAAEMAELHRRGDYSRDEQLADNIGFYATAEKIAKFLAS